MIGICLCSLPGNLYIKPNCWRNYIVCTSTLLIPLIKLSYLIYSPLFFSITFAVNMFGTLFLVLALFGPTISKPSQKSTDDYCYTTDEQPYLLFCSKTAYEYTHGDLSEAIVPESITQQSKSTSSFGICFSFSVHPYPIVVFKPTWYKVWRCFRHYQFRQLGQRTKPSCSQLWGGQEQPLSRRFWFVENVSFVGFCFNSSLLLLLLKLAMEWKYCAFNG